jgi:hypothetical protein
MVSESTADPGLRQRFGRVRIWPESQRDRAITGSALSWSFAAAGPLDRRRRPSGGYPEQVPVVFVLLREETLPRPSIARSW